VRPIAPAFVLPLAAALAACGSAAGNGSPAGSELAERNETQKSVPAARALQVTSREGGSVIDQADALTPADETRLRKRAAELSPGERPITVVLLNQLPGSTMERVGWAINKQGRNTDQVLLMVDPSQQRVRVEGQGVTPEQAARIAAAMQGSLSAGQVPEAVESGLLAARSTFGEDGRL
jgi:uncharacterized membrane protein YgcG